MNQVYNCFAAFNINITKTYFCPYHVDALVKKYKQDSFDRKPNPGMLLQARDDLGIDLLQSVLIGDSITDIQAANRAGITKTFLLTTPYHDLKNYEHLFSC